MAVAARDTSAGDVLEIERDGTGSGPPDGAGGESQSRQFVSFYVRGETFAVPLADVQEIIRLPDVVRLPLSPASLEGLANLRGRVLPILNLRQIFGLEMALHDDATRVVVLDQGQPVGMIVDRMANVMTVDADRIEGAATIKSTVDTDLLTGMIKDPGGRTMIMILDAVQLVQREFRALGARSTATALAAAGDAADAQGRAEREGSDEIQLVSFEAEGQEYAFPIELVHEIVQVPGSLTHVPNVSDHVLGVMTLRSRLLPLISLRALFGLKPADVDESNRIVVVTLGSGTAAISVGVVVDSVKEVLRVSRSIVDPMPPLLAKDEQLQDITAICRLDDGKRLVSIIAVDRMVRTAAVSDALKSLDGDKKAGENGMDKDAARTDGNDDEEQFVVFRLLNEEYGVSIEAVQEIVRVPDELTRVPKTPAFIEGVVNLRGTVLPVVDQRRRFGLPETARNDRQRIMVFTIHGLRTGFIVDSVSEVMRIPRAVIGAAPNLSEEQQRLVKRVANLEKQKRMILLLDVSQLLDLHEAKELGRQGA
jgi:purine-binding chemotaxis protein CheW